VDEEAKSPRGLKTIMKAVLVDKDYGSTTLEEQQAVQAAYAKAGIDLKLCHFTTEDEIIQGCKGAMAILATGNPPITRKVMEALPELKFVQRFGAGVNSIDLDAATDLDKIILFLPGFCIKELADLATAMILTLIRNAAYYDREIRKGNWPKCKYLLPGDVRTMTLGLYGFGGAGRILHDIFTKAFGTKVIACDPYVSEDIKKQYPDVEFVDFDGLLNNSDIISIHCILTPETKHVFNADAFKKMKKNSMIINTSRGPIIDQKALGEALAAGEIRYAGLDVVEKEPIDLADPLLKMDNVIINPHSGSYGEGSKKVQKEMVCAIIPNAVIVKQIPQKSVANKGVITKEKEYKFI